MSYGNIPDEPEEQPQVAGENAADTAVDGQHLLHEGDFYWEGPHVVFTANYHLRRGFCCNSACRHCPYK